MPVEDPPSRPLPEDFLPPNCTYSEQDWPVLARQWFPVARSDEALAKPRQVVLLNLRLVVYRMPDVIRISRDVCPHRGLPLSSGHVEGEELVCAYHGLRFGSNGQCRHVPEKLAPKTVDCFRIAVFPAIELHDLIWTCLMPENEPKVPEILSKRDAFEPDDVASLFKFSIDVLQFDSLSGKAVTEASAPHLLQELAQNEYQRLLNEISLGRVPNT